MIAKPSKARKKVKKAEKKVPTATPEVQERLQYGVLPWRITERGLEIMLVSSRDTKRWIVPKGWPMAGRSGAAAATIEAIEEAGLLGVVSEEPIGYFHYMKRLASRADYCRVVVFSMRVVRQRRHWPEQHERVTKWFPAEEASAEVSDAELGALIGIFARGFAG